LKALIKIETLKPIMGYFGDEIIDIKQWLNYLMGITGIELTSGPQTPINDKWKTNCNNKLLKSKMATNNWLKSSLIRVIIRDMNR